MKKFIFLAMTTLFLTSFSAFAQDGKFTEKERVTTEGRYAKGIRANLERLGYEATPEAVHELLASVGMSEGSTMEIVEVYYRAVTQVAVEAEPVEVSAVDLCKKACDAAYTSAIKNISDVLLTCLIVAGDDAAEQQQCRDRAEAGMTAAATTRDICRELCETTAK